MFSQAFSYFHCPVEFRNPMGIFSVQHALCSYMDGDAQAWKETATFRRDIISERYSRVLVSGIMYAQKSLQHYTVFRSQSGYSN